MATVQDLLKQYNITPGLNPNSPDYIASVTDRGDNGTSTYNNGTVYSSPQANNSITNTPASAYSYQPNTAGTLSDKQNGGWYNGVQYWANGQGPSGQVLGTNTDKGSTPPADQAKQQYFSYLDSAAGQLGDTQKALTDQVNSLFGGSQSTINTAQNNSLAELNQAGQKVDANQATSLRDLEQNMRNQMTAGQRYLGSIPGAANSSASGMYNYALGKLGNQNRANLLKQANDLHSNLDVQINKVKNTAQDQLAQLDTWKNSQLTQISQYIQQQRGQIDMAKANYIQSQLQNIDAQASQYKQMLQQWAMNNSTNLTQLQQTLAGFAQGNPTDLTQPNLNGTIATNGQTQGSSTDLVGSLEVQKKNPNGLKYLA